MFSQDSKFYQFSLTLYRLIILNVLVIVASLPIFTIGAAMSALVKVIYYKDASVARSFWAYYKSAVVKTIPILLFHVVSILFVLTINQLNIGQSMVMYYLIWLFILFLYTYNVNCYVAYLFYPEISLFQVFQLAFYFNVWTFYKTFWIPILMYLLIMYTYQYLGLVIILVSISFPIGLHITMIRKNIESFAEE
ncbi:DUF624 domain-containing protein [Fundicoccus culcitae]|uniref:DUF624 domain-containing protein n=1 Tax=Fundicoccus culcitae TaxID=2969821 RepID=A0ABY5P5W8_9LACT|nr:DUF624 domain-containing protein [Fundicoccus culcitae]UUX33875.1 DUF624 domain-containing protein [Fundicoccus culcitae]